MYFVLRPMRPGDGSSTAAIHGEVCPAAPHPWPVRSPHSGLRNTSQPTYRRSPTCFSLYLCMLVQMYY